MKTRSLTPCILLSILVILLLSTAVQANEYREVNAEVNASNISTHIENGDDIYLDNCSIVGELNVSKKKLETVPNPFFYNSVNEDNKEWLISNRVHENYSVVKNNITIKNSIFENSFNFSDVLLTGSTDFSGTNFNSSVEFRNAKFNSSAEFRNSKFNSSADFGWVSFNSSTDFEDANFNNFADFDWASFNSSAEFRNAKFNSSADFMDANFNSSADFLGVNFNSSADFSRVKFNSSANFWGVNFNSDAYFLDENFNSDAYFGDTNFNSDAYFGGTDFNSSAEFSRVKFNSSADFSVVIFNGSTDFLDANFYSSADFTYAHFYSDTTFNGASFNSSAKFLDANFYSSADFLNANFYSSADFAAPDTSKNIITDGKNCEIFMKYYNSKVRYTDTDNIYYNFRKNMQEKKELTDFSKWADTLSLVSCGYGTKLPYTLCWTGFFIIFFAVIYRNPFDWKKPGIYRSSEAISENKSRVSFLESLYFSINVFTGLGHADWHSRENFRKCVALEGLLGWIMLALVMATLMRLFIRP